MSLMTLSTNSTFTYLHNNNNSHGSNSVLNRIPSKKGKKPYKSWLKDGVSCGPSSMEVLITWLSNKSNYKKWKREDFPIDRVPKKDLLEEIIDKLRQVGIYHRLSKDVASKISTLQSNYRHTLKWKYSEGCKLKNQANGEQLLREELVKRFPYWDALHPVFGCSSSAMDIDNIVSQQGTPFQYKRQQSFDSNSSYSNSTASEDVYTFPTDYDLEKYINTSRRKEMERMQKSREMLCLLRKKKQERRKRQEHLVLQHEKLQIERDFINCLYKAGFTPTEALCYI